MPFLHANAAAGIVVKYYLHHFGFNYDFLTFYPEVSYEVADCTVELSPLLQSKLLK